MLYANSPVPLYKQLYHQYRDDIEDGKMKIGDPLPPERLMAAEHGISRETARKALEKLQQNGYVTTYHGIGSFVALSQLLQQRRIAFDSVEGWDNQQQLEREMEVVSCGVIAIASDMATTLKVEDYTRIIKVRRLRFIEGTPVALQNAYLPYKLCASILDLDLSKHALPRILEDELDLNLTYADQTVHLVLGEANDLALLNLDPPIVMVQHTQKVYDDQERLVLYLEELYRNDINIHTSNIV
jgi:GntR family transcriptional regulator